jgi:cytidylate kinase
MIITLDGPVASGKSTLAKALAQRNNFFHLSSGFFYRSYAFILLNRNVNLKNEKEVFDCASEANIVYKNTDTCEPIVEYNNQNIVLEILSEEIGFAASLISGYVKLREMIKREQRNYAMIYNKIILDGRDCGTRIFPDADYKFYITASVEERVKRIEKRSKKKFDIEMIERMQERDKNDRNRTFPAHDSYIIETSNLSFEIVLESLEKIICN